MEFRKNQLDRIKSYLVQGLTKKEMAIKLSWVPDRVQKAVQILIGQEQARIKRGERVFDLISVTGKNEPYHEDEMEYAKPMDKITEADLSPQELLIFAADER